MRWCLWAAMMVMVAGSAKADPVIRPLVKTGSWSTVELLPAVNAAPEACMIVEPAAAVALRSIGRVVDLMIANGHWDLPVGMRGAIHVTMAADTVSFPVTATTSSTATALVDSSALPTLLHAMVQGPSMRVMLFPHMPVTVQLAGFSSALPAFLHCAGLT
jgi:hypothetical protein